MILLDTNVVSEPMKQQGNPAVPAWLDEQVPETLYLATTSLAELLVGIQLPPLGKRREGMAASLAGLLDDLFGSRILAFDQRAAREYARLVSRTRAQGYSLSVGDGQIAAIAVVSGFTVATRDTAPFAAAGVPTIDPWTLNT